MQYLIRCGCLLALLGAGCSAKMQGYADTSAPPASGVNVPEGDSSDSAKATDDKASSDAGAKGDDKASTTDTSGDKN
jgi:hypothetical protein